MKSNNLCSSCTTIGCEFQSGIVRMECAFYMPPHIESDNCGNYVVMQPADDAISRQAVISTIYDNKSDFKNDFAQGFFADKIRDLSPVKPQETKTGHWRHYEGMLICSECGSEFYDDIMEYCGDDVPKCCPNCGAKMVEPQERSEE